MNPQREFRTYASEPGWLYGFVGRMMLQLVGAALPYSIFSNTIEILIDQLVGRHYNIHIRKHGKDGLLC